MATEAKTVHRLKVVSGGPTPGTVRKLPTDFYPMDAFHLPGFAKFGKR